MAPILQSVTVIPRSITVCPQTAFTYSTVMHARQDDFMRLTAYLMLAAHPILDASLAAGQAVAVVSL